MGFKAEWKPVPGTDLEIALSDTADSEIFSTFFAGYDRAFVLPDEKEDEAGIAACLALNSNEIGAGLARRYGRFAEICLIARDAASGLFVGGANFIAVQIGDGAAPLVSANLNYIYVDAAARGQGRFGQLLAAVRQAIRWAMDSDGDPLIFIELNDPVRMSAADYARDTAFTGLDQLDRLRIWRRRGARIVDHAYVQPALSADQAPDTNLIYGVLTDLPCLSACVLADHLRKFFAISVLKGAAIEDSPAASEQIALLDRQCRAGDQIAVLDPAPLLARAVQRDDIGILPGGMPGSMLEAVRALTD